jgi:ergothioneine biosynthesis protein EgtB
LKKRYLDIRQASLYICSKLKPEDYICQPVLWVSPPKWHLAHTTWFFETFVLTASLTGYEVFNTDYNFLFNSYYESIGERVSRNNRGMLFRPPVEDIYAYRRYVDKAMEELLANDLTPSTAKIIELGLQHEQQHQELLITDTKYIFSQNPLLPVWDESKTLDHLMQEANLSWLSVPEGIYTVGFQEEGFCFDNELNAHKQFISSFEIMDRPVTNAEYLEFVEAGGYKNFKYWLSEGWEWVNANKAEHPMYWHQRQGDYFFFHLDGLKKLDPSLPLMHINYYEADAFAHWRGLRLPTEFEWETAARLHPHAFNNLVWEWTQSAYLPYPGFSIAPGAIGEYNGKFMINQMVLRGGSIATPENHTRLSYRNFFHPQMQWQFSGLRLLRHTD